MRIIIEECPCGCSGDFGVYNNGILRLGNPQKVYENMLPMCLTHEILHEVIELVESLRASICFDNIFHMFDLNYLLMPKGFDGYLQQRAEHLFAWMVDS